MKTVFVVNRNKDSPDKFIITGLLKREDAKFATKISIFSKEFNNIISYFRDKIDGVYYDKFISDGKLKNKDYYASYSMLCKNNLLLNHISKINNKLFNNKEEMEALMAGAPYKMWNVLSLKDELERRGIPKSEFKDITDKDVLVELLKQNDLGGRRKKTKKPKKETTNKRKVEKMKAKQVRVFFPNLKNYKKAKNLLLDEEVDYKVKKDENDEEHFSKSLLVSSSDYKDLKKELTKLSTNGKDDGVKSKTGKGKKSKKVTKAETNGKVKKGKKGKKSNGSVTTNTADGVPGSRFDDVTTNGKRIPLDEATKKQLRKMTILNKIATTANDNRDDLIKILKKNGIKRVKC